MTSAMMSIPYVQQGHQGPACIMLVPQCSALQQAQQSLPPQQLPFQYFQVPQAFQDQQSPQEFVQRQQSRGFLQAQFVQLDGPYSTASTSTQCGASSHCSSPNGGVSTPDALDLLPARSPTSTPVGHPDSLPTELGDATRLRQPETTPSDGPHTARICHLQASPASQAASTGRPVVLPVAGNVVRLSRTLEGSREVQGAVESAPTDDARAAIAAELHGHVIAAAKCVNANHVLQKCITTTNPQSSQFIIDELCELGPRLSKLAKHKICCRIFQRLLEHCRPSQLELLVEIILADALALARHLYGTYVVQGIIEHGTREQRRRIIALLIDHVELMGADIHGSGTLSVALCHAEEADGLQLAKALLREPGMLASMAKSRRGHTAVIRALGALDGHRERIQAIGQLQAEIRSLRSCRYGKLVEAHLMDMVRRA